MKRHFIPITKVYLCMYIKDAKKSVYYLLFIYKMPYDINVICYTPVQCANDACLVRNHRVCACADTRMENTPLT